MVVVLPARFLFLSSWCDPQKMDKLPEFSAAWQANGIVHCGYAAGNAWVSLGLQIYHQRTQEEDLFGKSHFPRQNISIRLTYSMTNECTWSFMKRDEASMQDLTGEAGKPVMNLWWRREGAAAVCGKLGELMKATSICSLGAFCIVGIDYCSSLHLLYPHQ